MKSQVPVVIGGFGLGIYLAATASYSPQETESMDEWLASQQQKQMDFTGERQIARYERVLNAWLESQRKGKSGTEFWLEEGWNEPVQFFAVRSWEIVDRHDHGRFTVRIASSNRAGVPIETLWTIFLRGVAEPKICFVEDAIEWESRKASLDRQVEERLNGNID